MLDLVNYSLNKNKEESMGACGCVRIQTAHIPTFPADWPTPSSSPVLLFKEG